MWFQIELYLNSAPQGDPSDITCQTFDRQGSAYHEIQIIDRKNRLQRKHVCLCSRSKPFWIDAVRRLQRKSFPQKCFFNKL